METNTWKDHKGREVLITSMSDKWLNNIRKKFKQNHFDTRRKLLRNKSNNDEI